VIPRRYK